MTIEATDPATQAAQWLIRLDAGTADAQAFAAWRDADPRHAVAFAQAHAAWDRMGGITAREPASTVERDTGLGRRGLLRAAAVAIPAMAVGGGALTLLSGRPAYAATAIGERRRFAPLPGLMIELNTDSRVGWRLADASCELWLDRGEAAVLLEGARFSGAVLHCGPSDLMLAPGFYNARARAAGADLLVMDGRAWVRGGASASAVAGERIVFSGTDPIVARAPAAAIDATSAWRRGEIIFDGQSLNEALAEYNRYLGRKLVIDDPALGRLRIGGRFETQRPETFLAAVEIIFDLEAVDRADTVLLKRKIARQ